jgi:hypothetical protein
MALEAPLARASRLAARPRGSWEAGMMNDAVLLDHDTAIMLLDLLEAIEFDDGPESGAPRPADNATDIERRMQP